MAEVLSQSNDFLRFLVGRALFSLIESTLLVAVGWHLYQLTGDPFDLALVGLFQVTPVLALFLVTGWVVDHVSRKKILVAGALCQCVILFGIALVMNADEFSKWHLLLLLSASGAVKAFMSPAIQAALVNIVSSEKLNQAIAISSTVWNLATTVGPFIAGLLVASMAFDTYWLLVGASLFTLLSFTLLPAIKASNQVARSWAVVLGGFHFLKHNPSVFGCLLLDLLMVMLGSVVALLPVYAADILNVGAEGLGLMRAMPAVGAVLTGIYLSKYKQDFDNTGQTLFIALFIFALSILFFALADSLWLASVALFIYGASDMFSVVIRGAVVQHNTPDELRGRVSAVNSIFIASSNQLGDFRAGSAAAAFGAVNAALYGGVSALLVAAAGAWYFKDLRRLKSSKAKA
ncbi:MFS transporter [Catenovulum sp. 2E275]|uniref:MFS transporter n=1 Tax=Catenovulum sp. 2E275 TaxID=2980497 RepID=UPI0021D1DA47|nr:MFS transporter [Catenovulum sp. 2E275]MCU4677010.1 MFS transporter [Catenovulum sp. 2E275]